MFQVRVQGPWFVIAEPEPRTQTRNAERGTWNLSRVEYRPGLVFFTRFGGHDEH